MIQRLSTMTLTRSPNTGYSAASYRPAPHGDGHTCNNFLPDFCHIRIVFIVIVIAELLAFILALAPQDQTLDRWSKLSLISLFMQWIALSCTALLCLCRRYLGRINDLAAGLFSFALILLVTALLSGAAFWLGRNNGLDHIVIADQQLEFILRNITISGIIGAVVLRYFYVQHQTRQRVEAESQSRIQALQSRIRPHFLFNSLNTVASLTRSQPALAETLIEDLAELFRVSLSDATQLSTLEEELTLSRRYLGIEQLRLGKRLQVEWQVKDLPSGIQLPALLIQPLVENAIYHGIEPRPEGGKIRIHGQLQNKRIVITISNPHMGHPHHEQRSSNHMALENIRERLRLYYGKQGRLETCQDQGRFQASLSFPCTESSDEHSDH